MDLAELGRLADNLDAARALRLAADKTAASLKSEENALKAQLINKLATERTARQTDNTDNH